jgi:hypothetical protein
MDATLATRSDAWPQVDTPIVARLVRASTACLFVLAGLGAILLCARRAAGALAVPLATPTLLAAALFLALAAIVVRRWIAAEAEAARPSTRYVLSAVPTVVLALWAVGLLLPGTSAAGVIALVGLLVIEEVWSWRVMLRAAPAAVVAPVAEPIAGQRMPIAPAAFGTNVVEEPVDEVDEQEEGLLQRVVRRREDGGEVIDGFLVAEFAAGERQTAAHLAICPPFARVGVCDAEPVDGPASQVKVAQVLPYGVRFEVKLDEPADEPCTVTIEFVVREQAAE